MKKAKKLEARRMAKAFERAANLDGVCEGLSPLEAALKITRMMLAAKVRDKIKADFPDDPEEAGMLAGIDDETVVEVLEHLVEGDEVLDHGDDHAWFQNELRQYRDTAIKTERDLPLAQLAKRFASAA